MKGRAILLALIIVFLSYSTLSIAQLSLQEACVEGSKRPCGSNIGQCQAGIRTCKGNQWGECTGNTGPVQETCDGLDNNCNAQIDEDVCSPTQCADGSSRPCGSNIGECEAGVRICTGGSWGECTGSISPSQEICDGKDNNCNAIVDDSCIRQAKPIIKEELETVPADSTQQPKQEQPPDTGPSLSITGQQDTGTDGPPEMTLSSGNNIPVSNSAIFQCRGTDDLSLTKIYLWGSWNGWHKNATKNITMNNAAEQYNTTDNLDGTYTTSFQPNGTYGKDTYVSASPTETGNFDGNHMRIAGGSGHYTRFALIEFNLSMLFNDVTILNATLNFNKASGDTFTSEIRRITESWNESLVNWSGAPGHNSSFLYDSKTIGSSVEYNLTLLVQQWVNGTHNNYGLKVLPDVPNGGSLYLYSSDTGSSTTRPRLIIRYIFKNATAMFNVTGIPNGIYKWNCQAEDNATQTGFAPENMTVFVGQPSIILTKPADNYVYATTQTNVSFACNVEDDYAIQNISLYTNTTGTWKLNQTIRTGPLPDVPNHYTTTDNGDGTFTTVFQPNSVFGNDSYIDGEFTTANDGDDTSMLVGEDTDFFPARPWRALLRFDTDALPRAAVIKSAQLRVNRSAAPAYSFRVDAHRITNDWTESQVTWDQRKTGVNWNSAGGDYNSNIENFTTVPSSPPWTHFNVTNLVTGWVNGTYPNYGLLLKANSESDEYIAFISSDSTDSYARPMLNVTYTVPKSYNATFNVSGINQGHFAWNCMASDTYSNFGFSEFNRTFTVDPCLPPTESDWNMIQSCTISNKKVEVASGRRLNVSGGLSLTVINSTLITGDTLVDGKMTVMNSSNTVWQNGNLIINGYYSLSNSTLRMNGTTPHGMIGILVNSTGTMIVNQSSNITNGETGNYRYFFIVSNGSIFSIRDTGLSYVGWLDEKDKRGLEISTDRINFTNNILIRNSHGIVLYGHNNTIENNTIYLGTYGIRLFSKNNTIKNNTLTMLTNGIFLDDIIEEGTSENNLAMNNRLFNSSRGIVLKSSGNKIISNRIFNNSQEGIEIPLSGGNPFKNNLISFNIIENNRGDGIGKTFPLGTYALADSIISRNFIRNNSYGIRLSTYSANNLIVDNIILNSTAYDIWLSDGSTNNTFLNTTFDKTNVSVQGTGWITVQWYLDVYVFNNTGLVSQANVTGWNRTTEQYFSVFTNPSGYIERQNITEYVQNSTGQTFWTNYTINASNGIIRASIQLNITNSTFLAMSLVNPCYPPLDSDWNISSYCTLKDTEVKVAQNRNLNILSGGSLTLINVSLWMNLTGNGRSNITVMSGGAMNITDNQNDGSLINSTDRDSHFGFVVMQNSNFSIVNSQVEEAGWDSSRNHRGLEINTKIANFRGNSLRYNYQGLNIETSNNTIESNDISYNTNTGIQILQPAVNNTMVSNNITNNGVHGIYFLNSSKSNISLNNISRNTLYGVYLQNSQSITISRNIIKHNSNDGIFTTSGSNNTFIESNSIASNRHGMFISSANNVIRSNSIFSNSQDGIHFSGAINNTGTLNNLTDNVVDGIQILTSHYNNISNNNISRNSEYGASVRSNSDNNTIYGNNISYNQIDGVYIRDGPNNTIVEGNLISNNRHGINAYNGLKNTRIMNNNITNNTRSEGFGILLTTGVNNSIVRGNLISGNRDGIAITNSKGNVLQDNDILQSILNDIHIYGNGQNFIINTSFNKDKVTFEPGVIGALVVQWYLDVNVTDMSFGPLNNSNVTARNVTNHLYFTAFTNESGLITRQNVTEYIQDRNGKYYWTNYTVEASLNGSSASLRLNITNSTKINMTICLPPANSDWNLSISCTLRDTTVTIAQNRNLNILANGNLTLINATLRMNPTADGRANITVWPGGAIDIKDKNGDGSLITSTNANNEYGFVVKSGSNFSMINSQVEEAGWDNVLNHEGLEINTTLKEFRGNNITKNYRLVIYSNNNLISNSAFTSNQWGIRIGGSNNTISNSTFRSNSIYGIALTITVGNNTLINNTMEFNGFSGIYVNSNNNRIINSKLSGNAQQGIVLLGVNNTVLNSNISNNSIGIEFLMSPPSNKHNLVQDSIILNNNQSDIRASETSESNYNKLILLNSTFNKEKVTFAANSGDSIVVQWYLDVNVTDKRINPLQDAGVTALNVSNDTYFTQATDADGLIARQNVTEYIHDINGRNYWTNYTVIASKSGYRNSSLQLNLTGPAKINMTLEPVLSMVITKAFSPDNIVSRVNETVNVTVIVKLNDTLNNVSQINITDEMPYDFTPPSASEVKVYFYNYNQAGQVTEITNDVVKTVTPGSGQNNGRVNITIYNISTTTAGAYMEKNDYITINYLMTSSQMEPYTNRTTATNATMVDTDFSTSSGSLLSTIYSSLSVLRGSKNVWVPDLSNPQKISVRIEVKGIGGPIGDISFTDYLPAGAFIAENTTTYFNSSTTQNFQLVNGTDYRLGRLGEGVLPDGTFVDVYFYNFTSPCNQNKWNCFLYDNDSIVVYYNVTVLGGGQWVLPTLIAGFDPSYQKHIKTEMYAAANIPSFDVSIETTTPIIGQGDTVKGLLKMLNVGGPAAKVDVHAVYSIKTVEGELITDKSETFAVVESKEKEVALKTPITLEPGIYEFEAFVTYTGREAVSTDTFEVKGVGIGKAEQGFQSSFDSILYIIVVILVVILVLMFIIMRKVF